MICPTCGTNNLSGAKFCAACGTAISATSPPTGAAVSFAPSLPSGTLLQNGAFKIGAVLGQGGFGITYKGGDMSLKRFVAIKEFFPAGCMRNTQFVQPTGGMTIASYGDAKARFLEEARTLARFNHPGIVRVFATFEENNTAYMVMELLEGKTLAKLLEERGSLPESEAIAHIEKVADALTTVHAANMIHRDLKPDNIIATDNGRVVLIDFGTARAFASHKTVRQTAMLTPGYAPLEQYGQQARFGVPTDVYALGATLYHCLTGTAPPPATDRVTGVDLMPPDRVNPNVSPAVSRAVMWAMEIKATDRPQSMTEFAEALRGEATPNTTSNAVDFAPQTMVTPAPIYPQQRPPQSLPPFNPQLAPQRQNAPHRHVQGGKGGGVLTMGILGILGSFVCCGICAPIAWSMGNSALREYGDYDPGDRGTVQAGRIIGMIGTAIWGFYILVMVLAAMGSS